MDRTNLELPGAQAAMISQAEAANPNTIVYLETVGDVNLSSFESTTPALLWSSFNGEEQGAAFADVITGTVDPSGHLPFTWYADESQLPPITDYTIRPTATTDGRTYEYFTGTSDLPVRLRAQLHEFRLLATSTSTTTASSPNGTITVTAKVTQPWPGGLAGGAAVCHDPVRAGVSATPDQAARGLPEGDARPGQSKTVTFTVPALKLAFWNEDSNEYVVDPGRYGLEISTSSADSDIKLRSVGHDQRHDHRDADGGERQADRDRRPRSGVAQRVFFDINKTIDPQLTVSMNDQHLYGYVTKGQSTPLPAGLRSRTGRTTDGAVKVSGEHVRTVGSGIATVTATVRYQGGTASTSFTVDVAPLEFTSNPSTVFQGGAAGTFTVSTDSSPTATLTESGQLPTGVTFTDNGDGTATIAGTPPSQTGTFPITITAQNGVSPTIQQAFTLTVGTQPAITSANGAQLVVGAAGTATVSTSGFPTPSLTESGTLPSGVSFTDNGNGTATIAGTPANGTQGSYPLTITASNGLTPATQTLTLTVLAKAPTSHYGRAEPARRARRSPSGRSRSASRSAASACIWSPPVRPADAVPPVTSGSNGFYEFDGVPPGSYQVEFVDPTGTHVTQWYNGTATGSPNQAGASTLTLTAGNATVGINASLAAG